MVFTNTFLSWNTLVLQLFIRNFDSHSQRIFWLCRYNNSGNLRLNEFVDKRFLPFCSFFFAMKYPNACKSSAPNGFLCTFQYHTWGVFFVANLFSWSLWPTCKSPSSRRVFYSDIYGAGVVVVYKIILCGQFQSIYKYTSKFIRRSNIYHSPCSTFVWYADYIQTSYTILSFLHVANRDICLIARFYSLWHSRRNLIFLRWSILLFFLRS